MTSKVERLMTVEDLDALPDDDNRYELIEGELLVSRSPGIPHQLLLHKLQIEFDRFLKGQPIGVVVPGVGVIFSRYDAVIPDLSFVTHERWQQVVAIDRFVAAPNLVIEILSPGNENLERDLVLKRKLYAKYGVEEYWIVDGYKRQVIVFNLVNTNLVESGILTTADDLISSVMNGFRIDLVSLFSELP